VNNLKEIKVKKKQFTCIGHSVPKVDALGKVLGRAAYSEDMTFSGMLYGGVLGAGIPHARIKRIDTSRADAMDGVACVLTAKDIKGKKLYGIAFHDQPALADDKVRYSGIHLSGPYYIPHIKVDSYSAYTYNIIANAMRGFGVCQPAGVDKVGFQMGNCSDTVYNQVNAVKKAVGFPVGVKLTPTIAEGVPGGSGILPEPEKGRL
jgi:xanthine dehydrogenase molybdopterin-binding subunit B